MKKLAVSVFLCIFTFFSSVVTYAQQTPNLENGFKSYGSYDGSHMDTVNLMNGALQVHIPVHFSYPQRGKITHVFELESAAKGWTVVPNGGSGPTLGFNWAPLKSLGTRAPGSLASPSLVNSTDLTLHRMWQSDTPYGGNTSFSAWGYWLETPDGATHTLTGNPNTTDPTGEPTSFDSNDTSGFHVDLSSPDANGIPGAALVRDRNGNIYQFNGFNGKCSFWPHSDPSAMPAYSLTPSAHNYGSDIVRTCTQQSFAQTITDTNGNVFNTGVGSSASDTMGRTTVVTSSSSDYTGCVGTPSSAAVFTFAGIAGASTQLKTCISSLNVATSFNAKDGTGNAIGEYPSTPASLSTTVLLPDQTSYTFSYDSYGMITSIGLPGGGSIGYTWVTIGLPACGGTVPVSRAVASRTLNDGMGHSNTWNYHYGTVVNGVLTNIVTDPLGNDSVHTFTGLDPAGCRLYETSTKYYQGSSSSGQLLARVDTHYTFAYPCRRVGGRVSGR